MKTFTVKDFIRYNNPCFNCKSKISFTFKSSAPESIIPTVLLRTNVSPTYVEVELQITYVKTLILKINHTLNKIISPSLSTLTDYLEGHKLFLSSTCNNCYTFIESDQLDFNLQKGFIKPVLLNKEILMLNDNKNLYQINSYFKEGRSHLIVDRTDVASPLSSMHIHLPLIPLYKLKTKERSLNKLKTYILFS